MEELTITMDAEEFFKSVLGSNIAQQHALGKQFSAILKLKEPEWNTREKKVTIIVEYEGSFKNGNTKEQSITDAISRLDDVIPEGLSAYRPTSTKGTWHLYHGGQEGIIDGDPQDAGRGEQENME